MNEFYSAATGGGIEFSRSTLCLTIVVGLICVCIAIWDRSRRG